MISERNVDSDKLLAELTPLDIDEVVDPRRLIYLSPHSNTELIDVNDDDIYVIGALAERPSRPLTYSKATDKRLRSAKLPLDRYVKFCGGSKELTVDQCINILASLYQSGNDWKEAFKWIPSRKLKRNEDRDTWGIEVGLK
ncbi:hypothetical protein ACOME3_009296 [Neoechinorhynchus agilis]